MKGTWYLKYSIFVELCVQYHSALGQFLNVLFLELIYNLALLIELNFCILSYI